MLQNRLIITEKSKRKAIYENSKNKWIIDFEDKIKSWSDFYDIVQKEMDFWNYNEKFRKDAYTYRDIVGDLIVFEKMKERKKEEGTHFWIPSSWHIKNIILILLKIKLNNSNHRRIEFTEKVHTLIKADNSKQVNHSHL